MPGVMPLRGNPDVMKTTLYKLGTLCGLCAPIVWALAITLCGSLRPGYSHLSQYISELGERGSSTELLMRYAGFLPTGAMHVLFAGALYWAFKGGKIASVPALLLALNGLGRIAAGLFPCEVGCAGPRVLLSQKLHGLAAGVGFFALIGAAVTVGFILRRQEGSGRMSAYSLASGVLGLVFLLLMILSDESRAGTGLYERLSSGVLSLWVLVLAAALWQRKASAWGSAT
jgi:hypothetical membrane protein